MRAFTLTLSRDSMEFCFEGVSTNLYKVEESYAQTATYRSSSFLPLFLASVVNLFLEAS